jgi:ketosteroid isomerase-like protein
VIRRFFELSAAAVRELPDGRVLADVVFDLAGAQSGARFQKPAAVLYAVRDGKIAVPEHYMDRSAAREAAGIA